MCVCVCAEKMHIFVVVAMRLSFKHLRLSFYHCRRRLWCRLNCTACICMKCSIRWYSCMHFTQFTNDNWVSCKYTLGLNALSKALMSGIALPNTQSFRVILQPKDKEFFFEFLIFSKGKKTATHERMAQRNYVRVFQRHGNSGVVLPSFYRRIYSKNVKNYGTHHTTTKCQRLRSTVWCHHRVH